MRFAAGFGTRALGFPADAAGRGFGFGFDFDLGDGLGFGRAVRARRGFGAGDAAGRRGARGRRADPPSKASVARPQRSSSPRARSR